MLFASSKRIGYEIKRVPKAQTRTVDYDYGDLGIEITVLHDYLPRTREMDVLLKRHIDNYGIFSHCMYNLHDITSS